MRKQLLGVLLLAAALPAFGRIPSDVGQAFVEQFDADGNGSVSEKEFTAPYLQKAKEEFQAIDSNHDGQINAEEAERFAALMNQRMRDIPPQVPHP